MPENTCWFCGKEVTEDYGCLICQMCNEELIAILTNQDPEGESFCEGD